MQPLSKRPFLIRRDMDRCYGLPDEVRRSAIGNRRKLKDGFRELL